MRTKGKLKFDKYGNINKSGETLLLSGVAVSVGFTNKEAQANSQHLVKCWNAHDDLVEALKELTEQFSKVTPLYSKDNEIIAKAKTLFVAQM